jgi:hypothetical protein
MVWRVTVMIRELFHFWRYSLFSTYHGVTVGIEHWGTIAKHGCVAIRLQWCHNGVTE